MIPGIIHIIAHLGGIVQCAVEFEGRRGPGIVWQAPPSSGLFSADNNNSMYLSIRSLQQANLLRGSDTKAKAKSKLEYFRKNGRLETKLELRSRQRYHAQSNWRGICKESSHLRKKAIDQTRTWVQQSLGWWPIPQPPRTTGRPPLVSRRT